jgi:hypothetical protein
MIISPGVTSVIKHLFLYDSTVATGAGKTALVFTDITAYYVRAGGALTALTMVDITTLGTWDTDVTDDKLGFKKLHDTNSPGLYEIHLPNNILAVGANQVTVQLRATGMAPCNLEIQLVNAPAVVKAQDNIDFGALQKASLNAATPASVQNIPATGSGFTALGDTRIANLDAAVSTRSTATQGATKGELDAAQAAIEAAMPDVSALALEATLTAMKGAGWTDETLVALLAAVENISPVQIFEGLAVTVNSPLLTVSLDGVATKLTMKQGEAKTITFTVTDSDGVAVNLSAATLTLGVKATKADTVYSITKADGVFGKAQAALGIVTVALSATDTNLAENTYVGELKCSWAGGTTIEKTADWYLQIKGAVIPA